MYLYGTRSLFVCGIPGKACPLRRNTVFAVVRIEKLSQTLKLKFNVKESYAVVTPLRKAGSYELRIAILGIWGDKWLTRGKYGIYVAVRGSYGALTGSTDVTPSAA